MTDDELDKLWLKRNQVFKATIAHFRGQIPDWNRLPFMVTPHDNGEVLGLYPVGGICIVIPHDNDNFAAGMC